MGTDVSRSSSLTVRRRMLTVIDEAPLAHYCRHVPGCQVLTWPVCLMLCHLLLSADELLQEQKPDMDQFLSSISESQPDVTVSSEESVEVPVSEGKPYRPIQVTSLGSRSEPEGEQLRPQTQPQSGVMNNTVAVWRTIGHTHEPL